MFDRITNTEIKEIRKKAGLNKLAFIWWIVGIPTIVANSVGKNNYKLMIFTIIAFVVIGFLASNFISFYIKQKLKKYKK